MKQRILVLLAQGKTYNQIVAELGCAKSTVAYHAKNVKEPPSYKVYDWAEVQKYYDEGHSGRQCMTHFGICHSTWYTARRQGSIVLRDDLPIPLEMLTAQGRNTRRSHLRWRLLRDGVFEAKCAECGLTKWRNKPLSLHLHHINGVGNDNRLENLQLLCPNCHSQTENYSGRNVTRRESNKY